MLILFLILFIIILIFVAIETYKNYPKKLKDIEEKMTERLNDYNKIKK